MTTIAQTRDAWGRRRHQRGFTLIELIVAMGIMAVIGGLLHSFLFQAISARSDGGAKGELVTATTISTRWLVRDIHRAETTDIPDGSGTVSVASFFWSDGGGAHTCTYQLVGSGLQRTCDTVANELTTGFSNLLFSRNGDLVLVSFTVTASDRPDVNEQIDINIALGGD